MIPSERFLKALLEPLLSMRARARPLTPRPPHPPLTQTRPCQPILSDRSAGMATRRTARLLLEACEAYGDARARGSPAAIQKARRRMLMYCVLKHFTPPLVSPRVYFTQRDFPEVSFCARRAR